MRKRNALPPLDLLVGFEAAARHLSFTKAGEELFLTQSAVSRQMRELEESLGVELFTRRHRALALTEAGQQFYAAASQAIATMRAATAKLRALGTRSVLSVTTTPSFASLWLVPRLAGFRTVAPGIDVRLSADARFSDLERDGFDVGVRLCSAAFAGDSALKLFGENVFPVAAPDIAAQLKAPEDLARQVLLELDQHERTPPWLSWRSWLEMAGLADLKTQGLMRLPEYDHVVNAAQQGLGVALGRSELVRKALASGKLVAPFKREMSTERAYYVVTAPGAAERPAVQAFVAWLRKEARR